MSGKKNNENYENYENNDNNNNNEPNGVVRTVKAKKGAVPNNNAGAATRAAAARNAARNAEAKRAAAARNAAMNAEFRRAAAARTAEAARIAVATPETMAAESAESRRAAAAEASATTFTLSTGLPKSVGGLFGVGNSLSGKKLGFSPPRLFAKKRRTRRRSRKN